MKLFYNCWLCGMVCLALGCHDFEALSRRFTTDSSADGPSDGSQIGDGGPDSSSLGSIVLHDDFEAFSATQTWDNDQIHGDWKCIFTGRGSVGIAMSDSKVMELISPAVSGSNTSSALLSTVDNYGDLDFEVRVKTVAQNRVGSPPPNTWEVGWVDWHYTDNAHLYAFILKPNGWQLEKVVFNTATNLQEERYLATGPTPTFPIGQWYKLRIRQVGATISAWVDDAHLVDFTDSNDPYLTGSIVFYEEDAQAQWDDLVVRNPF